VALRRFGRNARGEVVSRTLIGVLQVPEPELSAELLAPVVRPLLGNEATPTGSEIQPIDYEIRSAISAGVYLVTGHAVTNGRRRNWSAVLKILQATSDTDRQSYGYWLREIHAYEQGPLPDGDLASPRLLAIRAPTKTTRWLWTEYVRGTPAVGWSTPDLVLAAERLGTFHHCPPSGTITFWPIAAEVGPCIGRQQQRRSTAASGTVHRRGDPAHLAGGSVTAGTAIGRLPRQMVVHATIVSPAGSPYALHSADSRRLEGG
jgi:hypothetical protein